MTKLKTNQKRKIRRRKANTRIRQDWAEGVNPIRNHIGKYVTSHMLRAFNERRFKCSIPPQSGKHAFYKWSPEQWCLWILRTGKFYFNI